MRGASNLRPTIDAQVVLCPVLGLWELVPLALDLRDVVPNRGVLAQRLSQLFSNSSCCHNLSRLLINLALLRVLNEQVVHGV